MIQTITVLGQLAILSMMSYRDIRQRVVLDRELMLFAFFNTIPLLLSTITPANHHGALASVSSALQSLDFNACVSLNADHPIWFSQLIFLLSSTGGAIFLLVVSLGLKIISSREMIGSGDILFTLAAGLGTGTWTSLRVVFLAFLLALPATIVIKLAHTARDARKEIAFIPFLSLAFILVRAFPNVSFWSKVFL